VSCVDVRCRTSPYINARGRTAPNVDVRCSSCLWSFAWLNYGAVMMTLWNYCVLLGSESELIRRHMSSGSMVSVCSSGGSQQSATSDVGGDKKKKPKVWVMLFSVWAPVVYLLLKAHLCNRGYSQWRRQRSKSGQRSDMVNFLFSVHTITEAKQSNRQGGARAVDLPARSFDLAGSFDLARPGVAPPLATARTP